MARMKRKDLLTAIRGAGYHGDKERALQLYLKHWVSQAVYAREFEIGAAMRVMGLPCECDDCGNRRALAVACQMDDRRIQSEVIADYRQFKRAPLAES